MVGVYTRMHVQKRKRTAQLGRPDEKGRMPGGVCPLKKEPRQGSHVLHGTRKQGSHVLHDTRRQRSHVLHGTRRQGSLPTRQRAEWHAWARTRTHAHAPHICNATHLARYNFFAQLPEPGRDDFKPLKPPKVLPVACIHRKDEVHRHLNACIDEVCDFACQHRVLSVLHSSQATPCTSTARHCHGGANHTPGSQGARCTVHSAASPSLPGPFKGEGGNGKKKTPKSVWVPSGPPHHWRTPPHKHPRGTARCASPS